MPYKERTEPKELQVMNVLNSRMSLSEQDLIQLSTLRKGYEGELLFDKLVENLQGNWLVLNDLLLKINNSLFQIDSLIITPEIINLSEIKNFEGDFYYESDRLYMKNKKEVNNPLNQLNKSTLLLKQMLQAIGFQMPIQSNVVFINPEFTLYQAPQNKPFIFPTQINKHLKNLGSTTSKINTKHKILAEKLVSLHLTDSPYNNIPDYEYKSLRKGIVCEKCVTFNMLLVGRRCKCNYCGHEQMVASSVINSVKDFKLLFPDSKLTTNAIYEWCGTALPKRRIRNVLEKNYKASGVHQWTFYE
ncbi:hypothetical protein JOC95_000673 [Bacillus tianshenii]|uniref:NERD domain-containing protein n=1 Tax=Sutcliffiella tianshenii TaxID=1463404 RepID=A0ABS2NW09_9BACI|nr:nuclease-related domain-containing protein [Bacillus tianshenii]MBM7618831.1 hypothetical protein [Bacillus tianshenii]